jgi:peptide/nickel transport system substrate-binding protein
MKRDRSSERLLALILIGCVSCSRDESSAATHSATSTLRIDPQRIVRRLTGDVNSLDPFRAHSMQELYVAQYLHTPLIYLDRDLKPAPGLAVRWDEAPDGKTYLFELDEHATFSDGTPVRASDVVFTLKRALDRDAHAFVMASTFAELDKPRTIAIGDRKVQVGFRAPLAGRLLDFNRVYVVPERSYAKGRTPDEEHLIGTGPYTLFSRSRGKLIVLKRRENYWRKKASVPTIFFKVIKNDTLAWNAFVNGEIDETWLSSDQWETVRNDARYAPLMKQFYTFNLETIAWNGRHPILGDKRVRNALALCVPVKEIIRDIYHGTARPLSGPFMPLSYAANPSIAPIEYDPVKAKRLLGTLGWRDRDGDGALDQGGKQLAFEMKFNTENGSAKKALQTFQARLKAIGVSMSLKGTDDATFLDEVTNGNYEAAYIARESGPEPDPFYAFHTSRFPPNGRNFVFYSNQEADQLMVLGRREMDQKKRAALYRRLHTILAADQPNTWLFQVQSKWVVSQRLMGVSESRGYGLFRWYPGELDWQLTPATGAGSRRKAA